MRRIVVFAILVALLAPSAFAWSGRGHVIVWMVAQERLKKSGHLAEANAFLAGAKLPPGCGAVAPSESCKRPMTCRSAKDAPVSPDDWRSFEGARITAGWHFANINITDDGYDRDRDCRSGACSVEELQMMKALVADEKQQKSSRSEALAYLIHIAGDLHQPFHNADRVRDGKGDRGGNDLPVKFHGEITNLHSVWDGGLIGTHATLKKDSDYAHFLLTTVLADRDAVDEQLLRAGLRLARLIEEALANAE
jgi:hypothetical protein